MLAFLSVQKASLASLLYTKVVSFRVSLVRGIAILEQILINYQLKFRNFRKDSISLTKVSCGYSLTSLIFSSLILTLLIPTTQPKKLTSLQQNLHFFSLISKQYQSRHLSTMQTYSLQSSLFLEQTRILSKYATTKMSRYALNTLLIRA